jgi:mono/diheme cytochrome c family protein
MFKKITLGVISVILITLLLAFIYVQFSWNKTYDLPYPDLQASTDPDIIALGEYYVNGPAHCSTCHTKNLSGGERFDLGGLGYVTTANLTPDNETGIGRYEDKEIFRMMRHAVKPNGKASIALMMPFWNMADNDMIAVVSYLRSLEPVRKEIPQPEWTMMGKVLKTFSATFKPVMDAEPPKTAPQMLATVERGKYLANSVANCVACHTKRDDMTFQPIAPEFSGGMLMGPETEQNVANGLDPDFMYETPNLTPHEKSKLAQFPTPESWIARFRAGRIFATSPMSWEWFSRMTDEDLTAIWLYLNSLDPVENTIVRTAFIKTDGNE